MTISAGGETAQGDPAADRRQHRARCGDHGAAAPSRPCSGTHFVITFTGIRPERAANYYSAGPLALPLGIAGRPPRRDRRPDPGHAARQLLGQPVDHRRPADRRGRGRARPSGARQHRGPGGPLRARRQRHRAGRRAPHGARPWATTRCAPASRPTCTGWNIDQLVLDSAAGGGAGPAATPTTPGVPELPATQPGPGPHGDVGAVHIDRRDGQRHRGHVALRAGLGPERERGLAGRGHPGPGRAAGFARGRPRALAAGRQLRQRVGGHRGRPQGPGRRDFTVTLTWTPQREVWAALASPAPRCCAASSSASCPAAGAGAGCAARLPRRLRGPAGPERARAAGRARSTPAVLALPSAPALMAQRQRGWLRFPRALLIGAACGGAARGDLRRGRLVVAGLVVAGLLVPWARSWPPWPASLIVAGCLSVIRARRSTTTCPGRTGPPPSSTRAT